MSGIVLPERIRAITLWQPWASLKCTSAKDYETRNRPAPSSFREGEIIAIHAAKREYRDESTKRGWQSDELSNLLRIFGEHTGLDVCYGDLPHGAIVGLCQYIDTMPTPCADVDDDERACGDYTPHRWAWHMPYIVRFGQSIEASGSQGVWWWEVPDNLRVIE